MLFQRAPPLLNESIVLGLMYWRERRRIYIKSPSSFRFNDLVIEGRYALVKITSGSRPRFFVCFGRRTRRLQPLLTNIGLTGGRTMGLHSDLISLLLFLFLCFLYILSFSQQEFVLALLSTEKSSYIGIHTYNERITSISLSEDQYLQ